MTDRTHGILLASLAGLFWGIMGVAAQYLFTDCGFTPVDLVSLRLIASGFALLAIDFALTHRNVFAPLTRRENLLPLFLYGAGVMTGQFTFFLSIDHSNAGTAAVLVGVIPLLIILWLAVSEGRRVRAREALCLVLALSGVFCLVTKGRLDKLDFSVAGVGFGLLSACAGAFTTLQPKRLLDRIGTSLTVGWGLVAGGLIMGIFNPPWKLDVVWTWNAAAAVAVIVLVGTVGAFWCYLQSTKYVSAAVTGLLVSFEPLSAVLLSVLLLDVAFGLWETFGVALILLNMVLLSLSGPKRKRATSPD